MALNGCYLNLLNLEGMKFIMAKANTSNTEKEFDAVAKQSIKYGGNYLKAEDKFKVKESDVKELSDYAEIEIPEETSTPLDNSGDGQKGQEPGGNGGQ